MTATLNRLNSVIRQIDRLHEILSEDVAGLSQLDQRLAAGAVEAKVGAARSLEATRKELEGLKSHDRQWVRRVLQVE
jgi:hypothetical protein